MSKTEIGFKDRAIALFDPQDVKRLLKIHTWRQLSKPVPWREINSRIGKYDQDRWYKRKLKVMETTPDIEILHLLQNAQPEPVGGFRGGQPASEEPKVPIFEVRAPRDDLKNTDNIDKIANADGDTYGMPTVLPDYGKIKPTGFVSDLDHDRWLIKYGSYSEEWNNQYLTDLRTSVWDSFKLMILEPRGHGKTWSMDGLFARWILEIGTPIQVYTNAGKKDEIFRMVLRILQSDEVRRDYGDVVSTSRENKGEIWKLDYLRYTPDGVPIEGADFRVIGKASQSVGGHPGWIHLEDVVQEMSLSEMTNSRMNAWFDRTVKYMKKKDTKVTITGTRKDIGDFYEHVETDHHFPVLKEEAITLVDGRFPKFDEVEPDHDRGVLKNWENVGEYSILHCPDWPLERLLYEYVFHYKAFEAEMQNNPLPSQGLYFPEQSFKVVKQLPDPAINYFLVCDPGFSKSKKSSGTAMAVFGIYLGKLYVIDSLIDKISSNELDDHFCDFHSTFSPVQSIIEDNYANISKNQDHTFRLLKLKGIKPVVNLADKYERIIGLSRPFARNQIVWLESCSFLDEWEKEILTFDPHEPGNEKKPFNALDCLVMAWDELMPLVSRSERNQDHQRSNLKVGAFRSNMKV